MRPTATPSAQARTLMGRVAGAIYLVSALVTVFAILAPHSPQADVHGFLAMAAVIAAVAGVLLRWPGRLRGWGYQGVMVLASLLVACSLYFNGERLGGPAAINEVLYIWIALYAGYFFTRAQIAVQVAWVGVTYAAALVAIHPGPIASTRWIITVSMVCAAAALVHALKAGNERLVARLGREAREDWLTGVLNRQGFDERLAAELERARDSGQPLALLLGDIDDFKAINDGDGHAAGDEALTEVGALLRRELRGVDTVARVGGDEFALLLPATDAAGGLRVAERMRGLTCDALAAGGTRLTMSFGIVDFPRHGATAAALLAAADGSLYAAKRAGRDRSVVA